MKLCISRWLYFLVGAVGTSVKRVLSVIGQVYALCYWSRWFRQITSAIGVGKVLYLIVGFKNSEL